MTDRQEAVLFGGQGSSGELNDTWTWKAGCWTQRTPLHNPPAVGNAAIAYDAGRRVVVLNGPYWSSVGPAVGTWVWDGNDWQAESTPPELAGVLAYDPNIQRVLMFADGLNQTWAWDGKQWVQLSSAREPGPRQGGESMVFDPATSSVLLFGGIGPNHEYLADTWSWSGSAWTRLNPAASPSGRAYAAMAPFSAKQRVLLVGGEDGAVLADAWMWDGTTWMSIPSPGPRSGTSAIDTGSQVMIFGGGNGGSTNDASLWDGVSWSAA